MILVALIAVLLGGGLLAWLSGRLSRRLPRWVALAAVSAGLALVAGSWAVGVAGTGAAPEGWRAELRWEWIPRFGIRFHLAMDALSFLLLLLTFFLGLMAIGASWESIRKRPGFYYFNLLWVLAGVAGVFLAVDLFLFALFWEVMLIPMVFLIILWGHERRVRAAIQFFIFTQAGGLLMLLAILGLAFFHGRETGVFTFGYFDLLGTRLPEPVGMALFLGFLAAFLVKLPAVPLHTWLPEAHTQAPTGGSVILAGLLLKTGAYGLLRFAVPLFPEAARDAAPWLMGLGVAGVIYGAVLAFGQRDLKRLVAYSSVSHMGFVLLGTFAWNEIALQGVVLEIICHGLSTGALFIVAGAVEKRLHTRDLASMGGLWSSMPRLGGMSLVFAMASLGLPGLGNFIAEFLVLLGTFQASVPLAVAATAGLVAAAVYSLWIVQRAFHGPPAAPAGLEDLTLHEGLVMGAMGALLVALGLFPEPVIETARPAVAYLLGGPL